MVVFNQLRITEDGKNLIIDCHIRQDIVKTYPDARIDKISICESSHYVSGTNNNVIEVYSYDFNNTSLNKDSVYKVVSVGDNVDLPVSFKDKLIFVYVDVKNIDESALPCNCSSPFIGVTMDMSGIYNQFMQYINELCATNKCGSNSTPNGFTDFILRYNAMLLAFDSKHYEKGIEFYDKWFNGKSVTTSSNCGCNG